jgi:hypothetical protein
MDIAVLASCLEQSIAPLYIENSMVLAEILMLVANCCLLTLPQLSQRP